MFRPTLVIGALLLAMVVKTACAAVYEPRALNYGSREQLNACLDSDDRIKAHGKLIADYIADNNATMIQIQIEAAMLVDLQSATATNNKAQVESFNRRIEEHNRLVKSADEHANKTKTELELYNKELADHNKRCAALVFKLEDREAVKKDRQAVGK